MHEESLKCLALASDDQEMDHSEDRIMTWFFFNLTFASIVSFRHSWDDGPRTVDGRFS